VECYFTSPLYPHGRQIAERLRATTDVYAWSVHQRCYDTQCFDVYRGLNRYQVAISSLYTYLPRLSSTNYTPSSVDIGHTRVGLHYAGLVVTLL